MLYCEHEVAKRVATRTVITNLLTQAVVIDTQGKLRLLWVRDLGKLRLQKALQKSEWGQYAK